MFLPDSNKCFFKCLAPYIHICLYYFLILCFYSHLLFLTLLATRHILLFTMFDSISLQSARNITEIRKTLHSSWRKKKCRVNFNQNKYSNIWYKIWVFPPSLFTFLFTYYFVTKKSLKNIPYRHVSQNCKQHSKIKKIAFSVKCFFNKVLLFTYKDMVKPYYIRRSVHRIKKKKERTKENIR